MFVCAYIFMRVYVKFAPNVRANASDSFFLCYLMEMYRIEKVGTAAELL